MPVAAQEVAMKPTVILVQGAAGEAGFAEGFSAQIKTWEGVAAKAKADVRVIGGTAAEAGKSREILEKQLTGLTGESPAAVWLVLVGHGTSNGKEAHFNLEGPDVSAAELGAWLKLVKRPVVVINTASSSAPFIPALAGPDRVVITATRSGNEKNFARFGQYLAASLEDAAADYDQDGHLTLLEWFLRASSRTTEFYLAEGRIQTEHALIDDNGDGKGTPAEWFRGLRAVSKAKDNSPVDGARAQQVSLLPDPAGAGLTAEQLEEREALEAQINALRDRKPTLGEEEYYQRLEELFRKLAAVMERAD